MSTSTDIRPTPTPSSERDLPQYGLRRVLAVWAAATLPMSALGWVVAPWLGARIGARDPFIQSLLICFDVGLLWMLALVLVLVRREQGSCSWATVRKALWLGAPRNPRSGRSGGRVWWWVLAFTAFSAAVNLLPVDPIGPLPRDFPHAILTDRVEHYFAGNWGGFALLVTNALLAPVVEELLFRGLLLPRMRAVCGRGDFLANGILFTLYHLHQPWSMPATLIDGVVNQAYATRRFRSTWMGLITHTAPSVLIIGVVLQLVL